MPDPIIPTPAGKKPEMTMEMRMLLAFALVLLVTFVTPYLYKQPQQADPKPAAAAAKPAAETAKPPAVAQAKPAAAPREVKQAASERTTVIDTALYHVELTNRGAAVKSWVLKKYKDLNGKPLELVNQRGGGKIPLPFAIEVKGNPLAAAANEALFVATEVPNGVDYEWTSEGTTVRKTFRFNPDNYRAEVSSEVVQGAAAVPHYLAWRGGFGDPTIHNAPSVERVVYWDNANGRLTGVTASDAKKSPVEASGNFTFAGIEDPYFTAVALPNEGAHVEVRTISEELPYGDKTDRFVGMNLGGAGVNRFPLFVGPKDSDVLKSVDPRLSQLIDWGRWFGFIAKPLFLALNWVNDHLTHNYGWAIVLVTVIINMLTLPLRLSSMKSAKKMQALQPLVEEINKRYKNTGMKDQQDKNQELMDLYKKHGVNPLGGCLPMVLQMPIFFAFYTALTVAIELRGANWLWVGDLSRPEQLAIRVLPILLIATQFWMQQMTPASPGADPAQQKMMKFMPLMMGWFFYYMSAGLVLYWLTGNIVGIAQQWVTNRTVTAPVIETKKKPGNHK